MSEKYLDNNGTQILINQIKEKCTLKVSTLPTASVDELGKIYQYVGETNSQYINGIFYKCVSNGAASPTYNWQLISVPLDTLKSVVAASSDFADFQTRIAAL